MPRSSSVSPKGFDNCIHLFTHHPKWDQKHFCHLRKNFCYPSQFRLSSGNHFVISITVNGFCIYSCFKRNHTGWGCMCVCVFIYRLLSLSVMSLRLLYVVMISVVLLFLLLKILLIIFHFINGLQWVSPFCCGWPFGFFPGLGSE